MQGTFGAWKKENNQIGILLLPNEYKKDSILVEVLLVKNFDV